MFSTDVWIGIVCSMMINAVLFGIGIVPVLSIPEISHLAKYLIPIVVVLSFILAPLVAIFIVPRMRIRYWGKRKWREGDLISG